MSSTLVQLPAPPRSWPMIRAMVGVGLLCGLLIVGVFIGTAPAIRANQEAALQAAIFEVLPAATKSASFLPRDDGGFAPVNDASPDGPRIHAGYDDAGRLVGLAIEGAAMGYADVIRVLWGYDPHREVVVGLQVLESKETPGLGDKIETDPAFVANFEALDIALNADRSALLHPVTGVKHGKKSERWQVDGVTGATISSFAIASALAQSGERWLPRAQRHLDDFRGGEAP